jgi:hypothetical protein
MHAPHWQHFSRWQALVFCEHSCVSSSAAACSLLFFKQLTQPATDWLLQQHAAPAYGSPTIAAWQQLLAATFQLLWLLPVYLVSLMVSCIW